MYSAGHDLKDAPNCTRWHTPSLHDYTLPSKLSRRSQVLSEYDPKYTSQYVLMYTSQYVLMYTSEYLLMYTTGHSLMDAPKDTRWHTPSLLDCTLPSKVCRRSQVHSEYAPKYTSEYVLMYTPGHALKDAPNYTRWHTPCLLDCTRANKLSRRSQTHSRAHSQLHSMTLPACLTIRCQVHSEYAPKYTTGYVLKFSPGHALQDAPNCTGWRTPSLLDGTLPSRFSRCTEAHSWARSQVHSPEARYSQSHLTIRSHVCSWVLDPETCWVGGARHREPGGRRQVAAAEIMMSANILVWTLFSARPPRRDLSMPHGHGVDICSLRFCRKSRQLDLGESGFPT